MLDSATIEVSIRDFGATRNIIREVRVGSGGSFTVKLGSNPTTGFTWTEMAEIADKAVLAQIDHRLVPADFKMIGAPAIEVWTFMALKEGRTSVDMEYSRPWQGGEKKEWTFRLNVKVE